MLKIPKIKIVSVKTSGKLGIEREFSTKYKGLDFVGIRLPYRDGKLPRIPKISVLLGDTVYEGVNKKRAELAEKLNPLANLFLRGFYCFRRVTDSHEVVGRLILQEDLLREDKAMKDVLMQMPELENKILACFPKEANPMLADSKYWGYAPVADGNESHRAHLEAEYQRDEFRNLTAQVTQARQELQLEIITSLRI